MNGGKIIIALFFVFTFFGMYFAVYGQYTISSSEYPIIGIKAKYDIDTTNAITVNVGSPGANQTWNFNQTLKGVEAQSEFVHPSATPDAGKFPTAEWAFRGFQWIRLDAKPPFLPNPTRTLSELTLYERTASDTVFGIGVKTVTLFYQSALPFDQEATNYVFPMEIGKTWTRISSYSTPATIGTITANPLTVSDSARIEVDAYGSLTIPYGTFQCVRLKIKRHLLIQARILLFGWMTITVDDAEFITYEWHTKDAGMLLQVSSHGGEESENFTSASLVVRMDSSSVLTGVECDPTCEPGSYIPEGFKLDQNYPNPFNPTTSIRYALPEPSRVELKVFSILGQEVAVVESGIKSAGLHNAVWNGENFYNKPLPGGVYFYQLKVIPISGNRIVVQTRKMIMMK